MKYWIMGPSKGYKMSIRKISKQIPVVMVDQPVIITKAMVMVAMVCYLMAIVIVMLRIIVIVVIPGVGPNLYHCRI